MRVITNGAEDDPASAPIVKYAKDIAKELRAAQGRVSTDFGNNPIKAKIQDAEQLRVHTMLVVGGRDMDAVAVSVRLHHGGPQGAKPKAEDIAAILGNIKERRVYSIFWNQRFPSQRNVRSLPAIGWSLMLA